MTLVAENKADFIQLHIAIGIGTTAMGPCSGWKGWTQPKYSMAKWEFTAKEQGGGQQMKHYSEETSW